MATSPTRHGHGRPRRFFVAVAILSVTSAIVFPGVGFASSDETTSESTTTSTTTSATTSTTTSTTTTTVPPPTTLPVTTTPLVVSDTTAPSVTIDQFLLQADPTNNPALAFLAVFSEPVYGFGANGVSIDGDAFVSSVVGGPQSYLVLVRANGDGIVSAAVPASGAHDTAGNLNVASTSTDNRVTVDTTSTHPTIATDQQDYAPGQTVTITGTGWVPGEVVTLAVSRDLANDGTDFATPYASWSIAAGADGTFTDSSFLILAADVDAVFTLVATGMNGSASTTFADSAATDCFRSVASTSWNTTSTWESAPLAGGCTVWSAATLTPTSAASTITIRSGNTVHVTAPVTVDQVTVDAGGDLEIDSATNLTVAHTAAATVDLLVNGTLGVSGTLRQVSSSIGSYVEVGGTGTARVYNGGLINGSGGNGSTVSKFTVASGGQWTIDAGGNLTEGGASGMQVFVNAGATATWNGAVTAGTTMTLNGTVTASANVTVASVSILQIGGTVTMTAGTLQVNRGNGGSMGSINSGGSLILQGSSIFNLSGVNASSYTAASGGTLDMGPSALVNGGAYLIVAVGANLKISSADGITTTNTAGNVRTSGNADTYDTAANYTYSGTAAQTTGGPVVGNNALPATVNNLTINNSAGVTLTLNAAQTVNGTLALTNGDLVASGASANITQPTSAPASTGTGDVVGTVVRSGTATIGTAYTLGNPNVQIAYTATAPAPTAVKLVKSAPAGKSGAITRTYTITPTGGSGYTATVRLRYLDGELNGNTESSLELWHLSGSWSAEGKTSNDTSANWVQLTGVAAATLSGDWTLADGSLTPTTTAITADNPDPSVVGQSVTVQYGVTGSGSPSGTVTVTDVDSAATCNSSVAVGQCSLTLTTVGAHHLTATYGGDVTHSGSASSPATDHTVNQAATTTSITSDTPDPSVVGQPYAVAFTVVVSAPGAGVPGGNVTVSDGTANCLGTVAAGTCTLTSTTVGAPKTLTATYAGDASFNGSVSAGASHTVNTAATTTSITTDTPDPSVVGQPYTVSFTVLTSLPGSGTATGNVTVSDGTASCIGTAAAGTCDLTSTSAGAKTLTATYAGDSNFTGSVSAGVAHTVNQANTTTTITSDDPDPTVVGESYAVAYAVAVVAPGAGTPTEYVTVSDGTDSCMGTPSEGSCTLTSTSAGAKTLVATYAGNPNFNGSVSEGVDHQVGAAETTTTIDSDGPDPSVVGESYAVAFTVTVDSPGSGTPTGNVTVSDGTQSCIGTVAAGTCNLTSTTAGAKTLIATYAGDAIFNGSVSAGASHTVNAADTTTTITSDAPDPSAVGQTYAVDVTVASLSPGTGVPTGTVSVDDGDGAVCVVTLLGGSGNCDLTSMQAGPHTITATYVPDANYNTSTDTEGHDVDPADTTTTITSDTPDPSVVGQSYAVTFTVAVDSPGSGTPTGNVTVSDGSGSCLGTVAVGSCNLTSTAPGVKTLTATYAGDSVFNGSVSAGVAHTVSQAATTSTITGATPAPSVVGQSYEVSFSVAVNAPGTGSPTGNVTVSDGIESCIGTVGAGSCNLVSTTAGAKTLTATYGGNLNFTGSISAVAAHLVDKADTTTTIDSDSPDSSVVGQPYSVSVSVAALGPGAGVPTGTVNLDDGDGAVCVVTLVAGSGACDLTSAEAGPHTITATYVTDANYNASSDTEGHDVDAADTTSTITSDTPDPSVLGETYAVAFTVAVDSPGSGTPTGNVTVSDGVDSCFGTVAAGTCNLTSSTAGAKTLTATYAGDANFDSSVSTGRAHTVNQAETTTTITADTPDPSAVDQPYAVTFTVTASAPGSGTPTGNVTVSDGTDSCIGTVAAGTCNLTSTTGGTKTLTATYAGDADFDGSVSAGVPHDVGKGETSISIIADTPDPSVVGEAYAVTFAVTATTPGSGTPTGAVTVSDGTQSCSGTVAAGTCNLTSTTAGSKTVTATYAGDPNFNGSSSVGVPHQVDQADTTTSITSDNPNPSVAGESVVMVFSVTANAPGSGTPTGNVNVTDAESGATCTATVAVGTCNLVLLTVGIHHLTATYLGDANYTDSASSPSTSANITRLTASYFGSRLNRVNASAGLSHQVVQSDTTTAITSHDPNPSLAGELVTVVFTVTVNAPGSGIPTGTVTITDLDSAATCSAAVAAGQCVLAFANPGVHHLIATYAGDADYTGSENTSVSATHQVNVPSPSAGPDPSAVATPYTVSFTG